MAIRGSGKSGVRALAAPLREAWAAMSCRTARRPASDSICDARMAVCEAPSKVAGARV